MTHSEFEDATQEAGLDLVPVRCSQCGTREMDETAVFEENEVFCSLLCLNTWKERQDQI